MYTAYGIVKPAQVFVLSVWDTEFIYNEMIKLPFEGKSSFTNTTSIKRVLPVLMWTWFIHKPWKCDQMFQRSSYNYADARNLIKLYFTVSLVNRQKQGAIYY